MAARSSMRNIDTRRKRGFAISDRYAAVATPSGTAIAIAISDVMTVPYRKPRMPKEGARSVGEGFQDAVQKLYCPARMSTGHASYTSTHARRAISTRMEMPAPRVSTPNTYSENRDGGRGGAGAASDMRASEVL